MWCLTNPAAAQPNGWSKKKGNDLDLRVFLVDLMGGYDGIHAGDHQIPTMVEAAGKFEPLFFVYIMTNETN